MLNKELLMMGSESLEPVLSIYISPDISSSPTVSGTLSSGATFYVGKAGETTFKFSELELTAIISIRDYGDAQLSYSNLLPALAAYSGRAEWAPSVTLDSFCIADKTQSARISIT